MPERKTRLSTLTACESGEPVRPALSVVMICFAIPPLRCLVRAVLRADSDSDSPAEGRQARWPATVATARTGYAQAVFRVWVALKCDSVRHWASTAPFGERAFDT